MSCKLKKLVVFLKKILSLKTRLNLLHSLYFVKVIFEKNIEPKICQIEGLV